MKPLWSLQTSLPDPHGVEAAVVNEGAVLDEVREDGAHGALVAGGLLAVARFDYLECGLPVALPRALITVGQVRFRGGSITQNL